MSGRLTVLLAGAGIGLATFAVAVDPWYGRVILAAAIAGGMALISLRNPRFAVVLVLCFLPWLAFLRRVLIPVFGWAPYDVLLLIAPVFSVFVAHRLLMLERRPIANDLLSKLVFALAALAVLESFNPGGGSLRAGLTGLLFLGAPLIWFFIGRELADRRLVCGLVAYMIVAGAATAGYGLMQVQSGFPSWDLSWIAINGYESLDVLGATRAFGTLSSSAEYATFVAVALVLTSVAILSGSRRWRLALPIVPLLAYALFLESSRGIVIFVLMAVVIVLGLRTGRLAWATLLASAAVICGLATTQFFGTQLTEMAQRSGNPFIIHQVAGLMNPLDPAQSTYLVHGQIAASGLVTSLEHPLGLGTAATNLAGQKLGATTAGTEIDVTNAFVSLGLPGGTIFLALFVVTFWRVGSLALSSRDAVTLGTMGVLIVTFGQWLNGGYYAVAPLIWILIGWANREWLIRQATRDTSSQSFAYQEVEGTEGGRWPVKPPTLGTWSSQSSASA